MRKKLSIAIAAILLAMCLAPSAALAQDGAVRGRGGAGLRVLV